VQVRVREVGRVPAALASPARPLVGFTQQELGDPEGEALLSDSARAVKEEACRESAGSRGAREARPELFMAVEIDDCHPA
jgi:hypothetical protein